LNTVVKTLQNRRACVVPRRHRPRRAQALELAPKAVRPALPEVADLQFAVAICGDARRLAIPDQSVDIIVTSPPYWQKRDYQVAGQIGQERTPELYVEAMAEALREWRRVLRPTGAVFLNVGDTYHKHTLLDLPGRIADAALRGRWTVRNRIIWVKNTGMPEPAKNRLANRYEHIIHLTPNRHSYYYDLFGYSAKYGNGANPGDVWVIEPSVNKSDHLAPFPEEIVDRILTLACPARVCVSCGIPRTRKVKRTTELNLDRPQARRALEIAQEKGLTPAHIAAIQATGISDAGKAKRFQTGTSKNSVEVRRLAEEAKKALGGYFREFTFSRRRSAGWSQCECRQAFMPGVVLDPFMGTCTTPKVALRRGFSAIGVDLNQESLNEFQASIASLFV
jgi:DNA modification methylase